MAIKNLFNLRLIEGTNAYASLSQFNQGVDA